MMSYEDAYADGLVLQCSKCGKLAAVPDDTPPGSSVVCPECTFREIITGRRLPNDDMKKGTFIAWCCILLLVVLPASASIWYYCHRLLHWFEATQ